MMGGEFDAGSAAANLPAGLADAALPYIPPARHPPHAEALHSGAQLQGADQADPEPKRSRRGVRWQGRTAHLDLTQEVGSISGTAQDASQAIARVQSKVARGLVSFNR